MRHEVQTIIRLSDRKCCTLGLKGMVYSSWVRSCLLNVLCEELRD